MKTNKFQYLFFNCFLLVGVASMAVSNIIMRNYTNNAYLVYLFLLPLILLTPLILPNSKQSLKICLNNTLLRILFFSYQLIFSFVLIVQIVHVFIQISGNRHPGRNQRKQYTANHNKSNHDNDQFFIHQIDYTPHFFLQKEYGSQKNQISDHTPKETEPNTILNKRLTNKERFCPDKLHRFNQKTLRIYGQMDGIPDQGKRNQHQCSPCYQQDQTDTPNIFIDHMHQRLLIRHLLHQFVF